MSKHRPSVIVVGGGTMGSATAWALARRGEPAVVLEQFQHVHTFGSHGGQTRIFRHAYSEGADYVPLMLRADDLWVQLQAESGLNFMHRTGILEMDAPGQTHAHAARDSGAHHGIPYEWMDGAEIRKRWPAFQPPDSWEGGFSDRGGFLEVEPALRSMAMLAKRAGIEIVPDSPVIAWGASENGVWAETPGGRYEADRLIVTAGSWSDRVMSNLGLPLTVVRKVLWWFDVDQPERFRPERFPVFAAGTDTGEIYGFPVFGMPGMKIADHHGGEVTTVDEVDRVARDDEKWHPLEVARDLIPGVSERVLNSAVCLYTRTPDEHFIIDRHPELPNVVFAAGFSGHGFKFATVVGEHLAELALDDDTGPYDLFALKRFAGARV